MSKVDSVNIAYFSDANTNDNLCDTGAITVTTEHKLYQQIQGQVDKIADYYDIIGGSLHYNVINPQTKRSLELLFYSNGEVRVTEQKKLPDGTFLVLKVHWVNALPQFMNILATLPTPA